MHIKEQMHQKSPALIRFMRYYVGSRRKISMSITPSFRQAAIAQRHALVDSPALRKLRVDHTVWTAVVYWDAYPDRVNMEQLRFELQRIRDSGISAVRFHLMHPTYLGNDTWDYQTGDRWFAAAADIGLPVVLCGEVFNSPPQSCLRNMASH
jgi:hypothetical protein